MFGASPLRVTLPAADLDRARRWYAEKLDLTPIRVGAGSLQYESGGACFTVYQSVFAGSNQATAGSFSVGDFDSTVEALGERGVPLENYDFEGLTTRDGVLTTPDGTRVAWVKDSEGNILGFVEG